MCLCQVCRVHLILFFVCLLIFREGKGGREGNINAWLLPKRPLLGTWPATQACALIGNQTRDSMVRRAGSPHFKPDFSGGGSAGA